MKLYKTLALMLSACAALLSGPATATEYPTRPISLIVGFGPGGPTDVIGRYVAQQISEKLGQTVIVENRPGANGLIALQHVKRAKPDGYTLLLASSGSLAIEPVYRKSIDYDVFEDFTVITPVAQYPYVMAVNAKSDVTSIADLIEQGKNAKHPLTFGSAGMGADNHLAGEWFSKKMDVPLTHIPYSGGDSALVNGMLTGAIDMALISGAVALPQVQAGNLRAIGVGTSERVSFLPDAPTVIEATGESDFLIGPWNGLIGPAGMNPDVVEKLEAVVQEALALEQTQKALMVHGQYPFFGSGKDFSDYIKTQQSHWTEVIDIAGLERLD